MQGEVTVKDLSKMDKLPANRKIDLIRVFIKNTRLDITSLIDDQFEKARCTASEFIKQTAIDEMDWHSLSELSGYLADNYCNGRDSATYTLIVTQFTKMYIELFDVYSFKDMSLYYDKPKEKLFGCHGFVWFNSTMEAINAASSYFEQNIRALNNLLEDMKDCIPINYNIRLGNDDIYAHPNAYYYPLVEPIEMRHKADRCIVVIDLSSEYHVVSFGVVKVDDLKPDTELEDMRHLHSVDLDTENITEEFESFITNMFTYYMERISTVRSKETNKNE